MTKVKDQGGLGIQLARGRNQALLTKLNWRFRTEKDALWAKVLQSKYCNNHRLHARATDKLPCSRVWKAIQRGSEVFHKGIRWIPGRNSSLSIWHDIWFAKAPLRTLIQGPLLEEEKSFQVKEVFGPHGWDWSKLSVQLPNDILTEINAMPYSLGASFEEDRLIWIGVKHGDFALKSAYSLAIRCSEEEEEFRGFWVWKVDTLPRIKSFIWKCLHNSIGVGDCLAKRHLSELDRCPICLTEVETIIHRLQDCKRVKTTWISLGVQPNSSFFEDSLPIWLEKNCKFNGCRVPNQPPWIILFPFVIWLLWKERNNVVFKGQNFRPGVHNEALFQALEFLHYVMDPKTPGSRRMIQIRWEKPSPGWVCLNIDGSALGNPGRAGCGGIIRNEHGD